MLIPTVLSLSEFFANNFPNISWYPYWYLGNPYYFLIGPVVPVALWGIRGIGEVGGIWLPIDGAYLLLILGSLVLGGIGLYFFLKDWEAERLQAIISGVLYIVLPAGFFLVKYQNGLNHIAFELLPYTFLVYRRFLIRESKLLMALMSLMISIVLLINISTFLPLIIGFIALFMSAGSIKSKENKIGKTVLIVLLSLSLSTLWYTPKFWWVVAMNPSLGGLPLGKLAWSILQFLLQFLPLALAIFVVKLKKYKPKGHLLFGLLFFTSFFFLSIVRFVSDPDFVMDWIGFGLELQMGGAILAGGVLVNLSKKTIGRTVLLACLTIAILLNCYIIFNILDSSRLRSNNNEIYETRITSLLQKHVKENERVFLSGSSVFFINSKLNIQQVRGGVDQSSIHPFWADGAYQIREGEDGDLAYDWLKILGVSYILVHDNGSKEPFKDFKYPLKFADSLSGFTLISAEEGDRLHRVNNSSIGRVTDAYILNAQKPKNGADKQTIANYILSFKKPLAVDFQKPNEITIEGNFEKGEIASLAVSYDSLWEIDYGKGKIVSDSLGNMAIIPQNIGPQKLELVYKRRLLDIAIPLGFSIAVLVLIARFNNIAPYVNRKFLSEDY